jgi:hypothetical protein
MVWRSQEWRIAQKQAERFTLLIVILILGTFFLLNLITYLLS